MLKKSVTFAETNFSIMKITIDNLGVVRHIEFDTQKPLSLFCGPNSTGKTYVAYVLYAIYNDDGAGTVVPDLCGTNHQES